MSGREPLLTTGSFIEKIIKVMFLMASFSYLGSLLDHSCLLLVLETVVLDMLPQAAGVSVPLVASVHIAFVRFLRKLI